jgi:hypothetical protein
MDSQNTPTEELIEKFGRVHVLDDLVCLRAADATQRPILAYPGFFEHGVFLYRRFTGQELDCLVDQTVEALMDYGFSPVTIVHLHPNDSSTNLI